MLDASGVPDPAYTIQGRCGFSKQLDSNYGLLMYARNGMRVPEARVMRREPCLSRIAKFKTSANSHMVYAEPHGRR